MQYSYWDSEMPNRTHSRGLQSLDSWVEEELPTCGKRTSRMLFLVDGLRGYVPATPTPARPDTLSTITPVFNIG